MLRYDPYARYSLLALALALLASTGRAQTVTEADEVAWAEPGAARREAAPAAPRGQPRPATRPSSDRLATVFRRSPESRPSERLAAAPNMFGDFLGLGGQIYASSLFVEGYSDLPLAGDCRRAKVAENNSALPRDRVYFLYNHFENAFEASAGPVGGLTPTRLPVERYTVGLEKTLFDGQWSVEVRMPFSQDLSYASGPFPGGGDFSMQGGNLGNLAVFLKNLLYECDCTAVSGGLGIDIPTGSDAQARFDDTFTSTQVTVFNDAVHLSPFLGVLHVPNDRLYYHGFLQIDIPCNGNRIAYEATDLLGGSTRSGTFNPLSEQSLLHVDLGAGYWLYREPSRAWLTGLAATAELHYTVALADANRVSESLAQDFEFGNLDPQWTVLNLTVGLHEQLTALTSCRVAGVFPLIASPNRDFDAEILVQFDRRF